MCVDIFAFFFQEQSNKHRVQLRDQKFEFVYIFRIDMIGKKFANIRFSLPLGMNSIIVEFDMRLHKRIVHPAAPELPLTKRKNFLYLL